MNKPDRFTDSERSSFYNGIQYLDPDNEYIITDIGNGTLNFNENSVKCHKKISGKPCDRELTLAFVFLLIIKQYKWPCHFIEIKPGLPDKRNNKTAVFLPDICIKNENGDSVILCTVQSIYDYRDMTDVSFHKHLLPLYETILLSNKIEKFFCLSLEVPVEKNHFPLYSTGICTRKVKSSTDWTGQGRPLLFFDFPVYKTEQKSHFFYTRLPGKSNDKNRKDLDRQFNIRKCRRIWDRLWNEIWGGTLEDNRKFENFNKVLLAKIYDEQKTKNGTPYVFQIKTRAGKIQTDEDLAYDIDLLYRRGYREYIARDQSIGLFQLKGIDFKEFPPLLVTQCVRLLQSLSFCRNRYTNTDILGEFYEKIIRKAFKQTKGLFLTHPNIVLFILAALDIETLIQEHEEKLPFIIDPSCGTGTFLILFLQYIRNHLKHEYNDLPAMNMKVKKQAIYRVEDYIYGIDKEEVLTRACQLNLILHGNGNKGVSTHIITMDSLSPLYKFPRDKLEGRGVLSLDNTTQFYGKPCLNQFDVIVSNPPFNTAVHPEIEDSFTVSGKSELYFLERWYQLLKPGGRLGVVLPESFFSVDDEFTGRLFLYRHFTIKAIVALPNHAFHPYTNINTSLLFAVKKTRDEEIEFLHKWEIYALAFKHYMDDIILLFPELSKMEEKVKQYFGSGFFVFPFFKSGVTGNPENHTAIKKTIKRVLLKNRERWIIKNISREKQEKFYNFSVRETGYKAGKKGSKNRPNELISIYDIHNNRIHDLKYSHEWKRIDKEDKQTVLGIIKSLHIWLPAPGKPDFIESVSCNAKEIICEENSLEYVCRFSPMRCDTHFTHYIRSAEGFFFNKKIEWVTLGSVLDDVRNGVNIPASYYSMEKTGIDYLSVTQVKEYGLDLKHRIHLTDQIREPDNFYELEENMVIITRSGTIGIALSTNHPSFCFKNSTYIPSGFLITAKVKPEYSADVIAHYINLPDVKHFLNAMSSGVCQKNISQPVIRNLPIPEVLLRNKNPFWNYFAEYDEKRMEIQKRIKEKEKELIQLKNEVVELVKREIARFYK
ncbi:MAG: N-6 DNA methylase [Spirochaetales bacterium]|nr:N-6 DNA methylase [Spirochaetales bacterium]